MHVDMMASFGGSNAWRSQYRPPSNSAFEGPLPSGRLWRFPRTDLIELALSRISESSKESGSGPHVCLLPFQPSKNWYAKLGGFEQVIK